jgi:fatty acid synthase
MNHFKKFLLYNMFISGYSLRAPSSSNPREFYESLRDGKDMTTPTRRYPPGYLGLPPRTGTIPTIDRFDQDFFKFSTKQTEKLDVAIRMLLEVTHEALMDAQLPIEQLKGTKTGVYVGHCFSDFLGRSTCDKSLTGYELVNGAHAMAANKISYFYDLKGPR